MQVPLTGILTNGTSYVFYWFTSGDEAVFESERFHVALKQDLTWQEKCRDAAKEVVLYVMQLLLEQSNKLWAAQEA